MKKEFILSIFSKLFSFIVSFIFIYLLNNEEINFAYLIYVAGIFNLCRMLDFSMPYLARVSYYEGISLSKKSTISFFSIVSILGYLFIYYLLEDYLISALIIIASRINNYSTFSLNVKQKSYFVNLPISISLFFAIYCEIFFKGYIDSVYAYFITYIMTSSIFLYPYFSNKKDFYSKAIYKIYKKDTFFHFLSILVWATYAEAHAIYLYQSISQEDFILLNKIIRSNLVVISGSAILTSVLWNQYGPHISKYDLIFNNLLLWFLGLIIISPAIYLSMNNAFIVNFFSNSNIFILFIGICFFSIYNLIVLQLLMRLRATLTVLIVSIFEALGMIACYLIFSDIELLLTQILYINVFKSLALYLYWLLLKKDYEKN